jgi:hypothetical protein
MEKLLELFKALLGITDDSQDAQLTQTLEIAQELVEDYLGRSLSYGKYEDWVEVARGQDTVVLKNYPIDLVLDIRDAATGLPVVYESGYIVKPSGEIRFRSSGQGDLVVTYMGGYLELPAWAQYAIVQTASAVWNSQGTGGAGAAGGSAVGGVKKETVYGVASIEYDTSGSSSGSVGGTVGGSVQHGAIPALVAHSLEQHRNRWV